MTGRMKIHKGTIVLDLTKPQETLWSEVDKKNRWSVNKAEKEGVSVRPGTVADHDRCYEIYSGMCKVNKLIPEGRNKVVSSGRLFVSEKDGTIIGFSTIKEDTVKKTATLSFNASDYEYRESQANSLLYWKTILHYKNGGFRKFLLGGVDLNANYRHGNDVFKMRWGGKLVTMADDVSLLEYVWWRFFRHSSFMRWLKYTIQSLFS